jgi:hypothetical protein
VAITGTRSDLTPASGGAAPRTPGLGDGRTPRRLWLVLVVVLAVVALVSLLMLRATSEDSAEDESGGEVVYEPIPAPEVAYDGPITITEGGTYTGNWESTDPDEPAVTIDTAEPVVIEGANLRARTNLVLGTDRVDLTIRNSYGTGLGGGAEPPRFLATDKGFSSVVIENNDMVGTAGLWLHQDGPDGEVSGEVRVVQNRARNIDGRLDRGDPVLVQFVQLDGVVSPDIEIAWNEIINELGDSRVEDVMSFYASGGTPDSPARVHDNFIWGAFPERTHQDFSGGGIMVGDTGSDIGWVVVEDNQVVGTTNYGISVVCGSNQTIRDNTILSSGQSRNGTPLSAANVGLSMGSEANWGADCTTYERNSATGNDLGWQGEDGRNDSWTPDCDDCSGNTSRDGELTYADEVAEYRRWLEKSAGTTVGRTSFPEPTIDAAGD